MASKVNDNQIYLSYEKHRPFFENALKWFQNNNNLELNRDNDKKSEFKFIKTIF